MFFVGCRLVVAAPMSVFVAAADADAALRLSQIQNRINIACTLSGMYRMYSTHHRSLLEIGRAQTNDAKSQ